MIQQYFRKALIFAGDRIRYIERKGRKMPMRKTVFLLVSWLLWLIGSCSLSEVWSSTAEIKHTTNDAFLSSSSREKIIAQLSKELAPANYDPKGLQFFVEHLSETDVIRANIQDIADHIYYSYIARKTMAWGPNLPEQIFLNFVLFHRAAQEPFEPYKPKFFSLLAPKVFKAKTIREAALTVNKWCAEQVFFRPTSAWDMGPLSLLKRRFGRCEELAILLVSALRSVAIPARIAWTPAWRHADGNHAWVEVYLDDGKWHFLDAASLQEDFDSPWFKPLLQYAPAVRTTSITEDACHDAQPYGGMFLCNETESYTTTQHIKVFVKDAQNNLPIRAHVRLLLWNSGRLRPVTAKNTDDAGLADFKAGQGGYIIEAVTQDGEQKGFACYEHALKEPVFVSVSKDLPESFKCRLYSPPNNVSPSPTPPSPYPSIAETTMESMRGLITSWRKDIDQELVNHLAEVGPNAFPLLALVSSLPNTDTETIKRLLLSVDPKGLALTNPLEVKEHFNHEVKVRSKRIRTGIVYDNETFWSYVLTPQFPDTPPFWRSSRLAKSFKISPDAGLLPTVEKVLKIAKRIRQIRPEFYSDPLNPEEVLTYGISHSRMETLIALGSLFRSVGIAALYDEVEDSLFIHDGKEWRLFNPEAPSSKKALEAIVSPGEIIVKIGGKETSCPDSRPTYGVHFSLTKPKGKERIFVKRPRIYWDNNVCGFKIVIPPGNYEFAVGYRLQSGGSDLFIKWLQIKSGERLQIDFPAN
jgi:hypothetical protein